MSEFVHKVQIYYEDTDLSGVVYHANYLKYFERAREHMIGPAELVRLWEEDNIGFVVYHAALTYREGARLGDSLEIRTTAVLESRYRAIFTHNVHREGSDAILVEGEVHLVCVDIRDSLVPLPDAARNTAD